MTIFSGFNTILFKACDKENSKIKNLFSMNNKILSKEL